MPVRSLLAAVVCFTAACSSPTLPVDGSFADHYIGSWRATVAMDSFSDYVFGKTGTLTTLRSVMNGISVDAMDGASVVHDPKTGVSCAFGDTWLTTAATDVTVGGVCTDSVARDIALDFGDGTTELSHVTVRSVAGELTWMAPASWDFERCDLHACD